MRVMGGDTYHIFQNVSTNDNFLLVLQSDPFELVKTPHRKAGQSSS